MTRKIRVQLINSHIDEDTFSGTIDEIISELKRIKLIGKGNGLENISIEYENDYSHDLGHDVIRFYIYGERDENSQEKEDRLKQETARKERVRKMNQTARETEHQEFLRLKKKFEPEAK